MTDVLDPVGIALSRHNGWLSVPREPSAEMLNASVHVAVATWAQRWVTTPSKRMLGWAIAVSQRGRETIVFTGRTAAERPTDSLQSAVLDAVAGHAGSIWVVVPGKRLGLARSVGQLGLSVSAGFRGLNRAEAALIPRADAERISLHAEALAVDSLNMFQVPARPSTARPEPAPQEWWPSGVQINESAVPTHLTVAADSSMSVAEDERSFGRCAISNDGDVVFDTGVTNGQIGSLELDAITFALGIVSRRSPRRATIFSDSETALKFAREGITAQTTPDEYRGLSFASRQRFLEALYEIPAGINIEFQHVQGHGNFGLILAADEIAGIARRASTVAREQIELRLEQQINTIVHSQQMP